MKRAPLWIATLGGRKTVLDSLWYHRVNEKNTKSCTLNENVGSIYIYNTTISKKQLKKVIYIGTTSSHIIEHTCPHPAAPTLPPNPH
jgi:hypothetical protein